MAFSVEKLNSGMLRTPAKAIIPDARFRTYLNGICGKVDVLKKLDVRTIAEMKSPSALNELSGLGKIFRNQAAEAIVSCKLLTLGLDVSENKELYEPIVESLSLFLMHAPEIYEDLCKVSRFSGVVGAMMGLSEEAVNELELAGYLHDIGKLPPPEDARRLVMASTGEKMTIGEAIAKLYSDRKLLAGPNETIGEFINRDVAGRKNFSAAQKEMMLNAVKKFTNLSENDTMMIFFNKHAEKSNKAINGKVSERIRLLVALHHIFKGIDPVGFKDLETTGDFLVTLQCLVVSDQVDAVIRRMSLQPDAAIKKVRADLEACISGRMELLKRFQHGQLNRILMNLGRMFAMESHGVITIYPETGRKPRA